MWWCVHDALLAPSQCGGAESAIASYQNDRGLFQTHRVPVVLGLSWRDNISQLFRVVVRTLIVLEVAVKTEYNPRNFLRVVPAELLRQYFDHRKALPNFDWASLGDDVEPLYVAWMTLPLDVRQAVSVDFQRVCGLALKGGIQTLLDVGLSNNVDLAPLVKAGGTDSRRLCGSDGHRPRQEL